MKIGIYDVELKNDYDPYLENWTWIEVHKNGRLIKNWETLRRLSDAFFAEEEE